MSKGDPENFIECFNLFCRYNQSKSKIHLLDNKTLDVIADRLEIDDWKHLIKALKAEKNNLHSLIIRSKFFYNDRYQNFKHQSKAPTFIKENLLRSILEAIQKTMENSQIMCSLHLEGIPLNKHIKLLNDGVHKQIHLQYLALPYCIMTDEDITLLCRNIYKHTGLQVVDLTGCGITRNGAKEISTVIRCQKLVRYEETWKQSLRYRLPQPNFLPGLRRITLNNNDKIGDDGFKLISYELMDDLWIKAMDFQNCGLTNSSVEDILELIKTNPTIIILDVRKNNISTGIVRNVTGLLKKNTVISENENYNWINDSVLSKSLTRSTNRSKPNGPASHKQSNLNSNTNLNTSEPIKMKPCVINDKIKSNNVLSELKETKFMLRKVSSSLVEEKIKREAIEKEHNKFRYQIEEIRKCLLHHTERNRSRKNVTPITSIRSIRRKSVSENNRKSKGNVSNNSNADHLKSTKLLLVVPVQTKNKCNEYTLATCNSAMRSRSVKGFCITKGFKNHGKQISTSESKIDARKKLKSTIAINNDD